LSIGIRINEACTAWLSRGFCFEQAAELLSMAVGNSISGRCGWYDFAMTWHFLGM